MSCSASWPRKTAAFLVLALTAGACAADSARARNPSPQPHAQSVFGADPNLSNGALALRLGDHEQGIRLTLEGLRSPAGKAHSVRTRSSAHSNLCAGYLMAGQLRTALEHCNEALRLRKGNWQAYSNRAVLYAITGQLERAAQDLEEGKRPMCRSRRRLIDASVRAG